MLCLFKICFYQPLTLFKFFNELSYHFLYLCSLIYTFIAFIYQSFIRVPYYVFLSNDLPSYLDRQQAKESSQAYSNSIHIHIEAISHWQEVSFLAHCWLSILLLDTPQERHVTPNQEESQSQICCLSQICNQ
jgi:hypothetical protein